MMDLERLKKWCGALVVACGGSATVFGLMLVMNGYNQAPEKPELERRQEFSVAPKPEPPKQRPKPKPKPKEQRAPRPEGAPPPSLDAAIGSVGLELPGFAPAQMHEDSGELLGEVEASVMTADSVDEKPRPMRRVQPELSRRLVAEQIEGEVLAEALIDAQGRVERVRIRRAEPAGVFDAAVEEALRQWRFQPATYKGEPVKMWATIPFHFELG
jgi:periplasmic protein TonB